MSREFMIKILERKFHVAINKLLSLFFFFLVGLNSFLIINFLVEGVKITLGRLLMNYIKNNVFIECNTIHGIRCIYIY